MSKILGYFSARISKHIKARRYPDSPWEVLRKPEDPAANRNHPFGSMREAEVIFIKPDTWYCHKANNHWQHSVPIENSCSMWHSCADVLIFLIILHYVLFAYVINETRCPWKTGRPLCSMVFGEVAEAIEKLRQRTEWHWFSWRKHMS